MEVSGGEKKREPEKRPLVFTDCNNPIDKMTFTLQFLDDFFPVTALPLVISPCSRVSVGRDEQTCRGCEKIRAKTVSARPIPLSFFFFSTPHVPSSRPCELRA